MAKFIQDENWHTIKANEAELLAQLNPKKYSREMQERLLRILKRSQQSNHMRSELIGWHDTPDEGMKDNG